MYHQTLERFFFSKRVHHLMFSTQSLINLMFKFQLVILFLHLWMENIHIHWRIWWWHKGWFWNFNAYNLFILGTKPNQPRNHSKHSSCHWWVPGGTGAVLCSRRPVFADTTLFWRQPQRCLEELSQHDSRKLCLSVNPHQWSLFSALLIPLPTTLEYFFQKKKEKKLQNTKIKKYLNLKKQTKKTIFLKFNKF